MAYPKCGAKTRTGTSCERPCGWGTDHAGEGRCKLHAGCSLRGRDHPAFKHGLYTQHLTDDEAVEFQEFCERLSWVEPSSEEAYGLYRLMRAICSPGHLEPAVLARVLRSVAQTKRDYKELLEGIQVNVHFENAEIELIIEKVVEIVTKYVPIDKHDQVIAELREVTGRFAL